MPTLSTPKERLKLAVLHAQTKQSDIARALGITKQQVGRVGQPGYESGGVAEAVADALKVSLEWLVNGTGPAPAWAGGDQPRPVILTGGQGLRVVGVVSAGDGRTAGDPYTEASDPFPIPDSWDVVEVQGDSAYPVAYNGQFAMIDTARAVTPETINAEAMRDLHDNLVLIQTREGGTPRAYLKRFCAEPRSPCGYTLASVNSGRGSPYLPPESIDLITPVVGVVFEDPRKPRVKGRIKPPSDPVTPEGKSRDLRA